MLTFHFHHCLNIKVYCKFDSLFSGGVPNTIIQKFADYNLFKLNNYRGCIRDFSFGNDADLQIKDFSIYEGQNIGVCDFYDEFL